MGSMWGSDLAYHLPDKVKKFWKTFVAAVLPSYAIRYAASFEGVVTVLSGMSDLEQVEDNVSYMGDFKPLTEREVEAIDQVRDILKGQDIIPCTGCRYCMEGCSRNILIPRLFACMNERKKFKDWNNYGTYAHYTTKYGKASDCIGCGQCEQACPQRLPVRKLLMEIVAVYDYPQ